MKLEGFCIMFFNITQCCQNVYSMSYPVSSVYSERLFPEAGNLYEEKCSRLLFQTEQQLFLHHKHPRFQLTDPSQLMHTVQHSHRLTFQFHNEEQERFFFCTYITAG